MRSTARDVSASAAMFCGYPVGTVEIRKGDDKINDMRAWLG